MAGQEYRNKNFINYSAEDLNNWLRDLPNAPDIEGEQAVITAAQARRISNNIDDLEATGQDMLDMDVQDLRDVLPNVPGMLLRRLRQHIRNRANDEEDQRDDPDDPNDPGIGNDEEFLLTVGGYPNVSVRPRWTVAQVIQAIHDQQNANLAVDFVDLYHNGRILDRSATLASYNIRTSRTTLQMQFRRRGGMFSKTKGEIRSSKPFYITLKGNDEPYKLKSCFFCYNKVFLIKIMYLKEMKTKGLRRRDIKLYTKPGILQRITNQYKSGLYNKKNNNNNNNNDELMEMNDNDELSDYDIYSDTTLTIKIIQKKNKWLVPLKKLDTNGLNEYIHTLSLGGTSQQIYKKKIDGKALNKCKNANDIAQLLGIDAKKAGLLLNAMEQQKKIDKMSKNDKIVYYKKLADMYKTNNIKNWNIDQVMAFIESINIDKKYKDIIQGFVKTHGLNGDYFTIIQNVDDLFKETFCNKIPKNICVIIFNELKKYTKIMPGIKSSNNTDIIDSKDNDDSKDNRKYFNVIDDPKYKFKKRMLNLRKYRAIKLSKNECCIAKDKIDQRAKMICNHAITSESMYKYIRSIYTTTEYAYKIYCPVSECIDNQTGKQYEWNWDLCTKIADMDDEEYRKWSKLRKDRVLKDQKKCPKCRKYNKKNEYIKTKCIDCNHTFCWFCSNAWKSNNNNRCGNNSCIKIIQINERLKNAKWEPHLNMYTDYKVPKVRACPKCFELIDRIDGCEHMHCKYCDNRFCFHCLKSRINKKWQCNNKKHGFCIEIAKVQQF